MSSRGLTQFRLAGVAVACAIVAVVLLTGWGLYISTSQKREIERVLFYAAKGEAERHLETIDEGISRLEAELLDALEVAVGSGRDASRPIASGLHELERRFELLRMPLVLAPDGRFLYPPVDSRRDEVDSPLLSDEPAPDDYLQAMRLVWSDAPAADALRALESVYRAPEMAPQWRLRAVAAIANLQMKRDEPSSAVATHERLSEEFVEELAKRSTRPSRLHLALAHAEALRASDRGDEALDLLLSSLQDVIETRITPLSIDEEVYFVDRVRDWGDDAAGAVADRRGALLKFHGERLEFLDSTRGLSEWETVARQIRLARAEGLGDTAQRLGLTLAEERRLIAWRAADRRGPGARTSGAAATVGVVGFEARTGALCVVVERLLSTATTSTAPDAADRFAYRVAPSTEELAPDLPSIVLPDELSFLRVSVEPESWSQRLTAARRPYRFATILLPALGLTLIMALVMFWLSYRRERHLSQVKTDFVANVSHELKTPLALIRLFGETLSLGRVPTEEKKKEYYEIITRESERLTLLINNVLDFASIEAEKKSYEFAPIDIGATVRGTLQTYQFHLEEKGFTVSVDVPESLPRCLADPNAISQALINLLNNAVKYSDGTREISVRVRGAEGELGIAVADRGVGISAEDRRRIFEGFYRAESARKLGQRGSGLGLTLVQHILRAHGGRVEVRSELGEGSEFTLVLPAIAADDTKNETKGAPSREETRKS